MPSTFVLVSGLIALFVTLRVWRIVDGRRRGRAPLSEGAGTSVRIKTVNALVVAVTRASVGLMLLGVAIALLFFAAGNAQAGVAISIVSLGLPPLGILNFRLAHRGSIELRDDALVIRASNAIHEYPWRHIESMRVATWPESGRVRAAFIHAMGARMDEPFVSMRLSHSVSMSMGIWTSRYGTEVSGLPMLVRHIMLFVDDPNGFVELTRAHMGETNQELAA